MTIPDNQQEHKISQRQAGYHQRQPESYKRILHGCVSCNEKIQHGNRIRNQHQNDEDLNQDPMLKFLST